MLIVLCGVAKLYVGDLTEAGERCCTASWVLAWWLCCTRQALLFETERPCTAPDLYATDAFWDPTYSAAHMLGLQRSYSVLHKKSSPPCVWNTLLWPTSTCELTQTGLQTLELESAFACERTPVSQSFGLAASAALRFLCAG